MEVSYTESSSSSSGEIEEIIDELEMRFRKFKNFDTLMHPPPDHRYVQKYNLWDQFSHGQQDAAATTARVWQSLASGLPDSIYVRAYSMRIDVIRVAMVGPRNTPYTNSLFFLDIFFPSKYPAKAPRIFGLAVNPSPYANKEIRLTIKYKAGTDPSSIIQELISVRSLLSANQWFSRDQNIHGGHAKSFKQGKNLFVQCCETMLHTLSMPPCDFKDLVAGHFRTQAHQILMTCRPLLQGDNVPVMQLFAKLITAFKDNGTYCQHHLSLLPEELRPKKEEPPPKKEEQQVVRRRDLSMGTSIFI